MRVGVAAGACVRSADLDVLASPFCAGKTSAINCLCGYQTPSSGTAIVAGLDILNDIGRSYV